MSDPLLDEALRLSSLGLPLHWLWPRTKIPRSLSYQTAPWLSPQQLRATYQRGNNLGLHTGLVHGARLCIVALDIDSPEAEQWAASNVTPTQVRSRSAKGWAWLYRHPGPGFRIGNRVKIRIAGGRIALDVRADGGNLAIPPSIHPTGVRYRAPEPWTPELLASLPTFDPSWIPQTPAAPAVPTRSTRTDDQSLLERGRRLALRWQLAERGFGQGTETFKLAGYLIHRIGLSPHDAYDVIALHYNPRCLQPYGEPALRRKVAEAAYKIRNREARP